ncbi:MAG: histidinol dehydrogenase [Clostridiales bacterium]|nr:histidinol dehydrogenase [Clostridiales bacterium]
MIKVLKEGVNTREEIFCPNEVKIDVEQIVSDIIENVIKNGDKALLEYALKFDKVNLTSLEVSKEEIESAVKNADKEFLRILNRAKQNIYEFHQKQYREGFEIRKENGIILGQKIIPIEKVGLYVPGGTASYPSTVLMDAIPAKIAGSSKIVMVTPPDKNGNVNPDILVSAYVAGVDKIYKVGGAQAIAALAYGTETIEKVDKIVGPGNAFVATAKKQVFGKVSIDMIAGPSEIMVVADKNNHAKCISADLLSQAEHDKLASAVLITDSEELAYKVRDEIEVQLSKLSRCDIARTSIDDNGKIIIAKDIESAIELANEIAPEHLELCIDNAYDYIDKIKNAGSVFLGRYSPEALGDYMAGLNHTLPTSGTARFSSPLSVDDFIKKMQYVYYTEDALCGIYKDIDYFAKKEGLSAHAKSATIRFEENE